MLKIYQKYIINLYTKLLVKITGVFFILTFVLNIFEEINYFKDTDVGFLFPIFLTLLNIPSLIFEILPFIFLITTQFFFLRLLETDELNIFKVYSLSNIKIINILNFTNFILGLIIVLFFYNISAKFKFNYLDIKNKYSGDNKYLAVITENGLWIKDELNNKSNIINAEKIEENFLKNVSILQFNEKHELLMSIESEKIDISKNIWSIKNPIVFEDNMNITSYKEIPFETNFNLDKINSLFSNMSSLNFLQLYKLKKDYQSLSYSTREIDVHVQKMAVYPFYLMTMSILSAIIMLNIKHNNPTIFYIILGILMSVIIYYINYFFSLLGKNGNMPIVLATWSPIIIINIFSLIGLIRINEK